MMEIPQAAAADPMAHPAGPAVPSANPWLRFTIRRLGQLLISALVLVTASFLWDAVNKRRQANDDRDT